MMIMMIIALYILGITIRYLSIYIVVVRVRSCLGKYVFVHGFVWVPGKS